jgi:hypothetical protein
MCKEERQDFLASQQNRKGFDISSKTNERDLKESLGYRVANGIFEQGIQVGCSFCGATFWYGLEELKEQIKCKGCRMLNQVPIEAEWSYKLNELLQNAISQHGVLPAIWALGYLLSSARESFLYLNGIEIYNNYLFRRPDRELDLVCIVDGELIIGDIKTNSAEFSKEALDDLVAISKKVLPQKVIIFCLEDSNGQLKRKAEILEKELVPFKIQVMGRKPDSYFFEPVYHL